MSRFLISSMGRFLNCNRHKLSALAALATFCTLAIFIFIFWWYVPQQEINQAVLTPKERLDSENAIRATLTQTLTTLVQAVGGAAFVTGLFFTWQNLQIAQKSLEVGQKNLRATEEKQVTERFGKAIEHLGHNSLEIRLGGIHALERIARDSDKDYWQVMEILTAFVREKSPWPPKEEEAKKNKISIDIQAALTVLGRRQKSYEEGEDYRLDLVATDLRWANLTGCNFRGVNLEGANLQDSTLMKASLQFAILVVLKM